jgi:hypothetical protein
MDPLLYVRLAYRLFEKIAGAATTVPERGEWERMSRRPAPSRERARPLDLTDEQWTILSSPHLLDGIVNKVTGLASLVQNPGSRRIEFP